MAKAWPILFLITYWGFFFVSGLFNQDNLIIGLLLLMTAYAGPLPRKLFRFVFPVALTYVVYQTQPLYAEGLRGRIRVLEPYLFDYALFGIDTEAGRMTWPEWWQQNTYAVLDFITGLSYILYVFTFMAIGAWWVFFKPLRYQVAGFRMMWTFFICNMIGYSTYYWYPAAPPWYAAKFGLGPANPNAMPDAAGAARFDALLNVELFSGFYSKNANAFGAIPSLHIVYPLIAVFYAFKLRSLRVPALINFVIVAFAAVYLNHHYVLDILWGAVYVIIAFPLIEWVARRHEVMQPKTSIDQPGTA